MTDTSQLPRETGTRSLLKAISWRVVATLTTAAIAFAVTGEVMAAVLIGGSEFFIKLAIYYIHERLWHQIKFGLESN